MKCCLSCTYIFTLEISRMSLSETVDELNAHFLVLIKMKVGMKKGFRAVSSWFSDTGYLLQVTDEWTLFYQHYTRSPGFGQESDNGELWKHTVECKAWLVISCTLRSAFLQLYCVRTFTVAVHHELWLKLYPIDYSIFYWKTGGNLLFWGKTVAYCIKSSEVALLNSRITIDLMSMKSIWLSNEPVLSVNHSERWVLLLNTQTVSSRMILTKTIWNISSTTLRLGQKKRVSRQHDENDDAYYDEINKNYVRQQKKSEGYLRQFKKVWYAIRYEEDEPGSNSSISRYLRLPKRTNDDCGINRSTKRLNASFHRAILLDVVRQAKSYSVVVLRVDKSLRIIMQSPTEVMK